MVNLPVKIKKEWGLLQCKEEDKCNICAGIWHDKNVLIKVRDLYALGVDTWSIEKSFDLPIGSIAGHAYRRKWDIKRRKGNVLSLREEVVLLARKRLKDNWESSNEGTPDKMVDILAKAADIGSNRGVVVGVNVNNNNSNNGEMSYEERTFQRRGSVIDVQPTLIEKEEEDNNNEQ